MARKKKTPKAKNPIAVAMRRRFGATTTTMKDRRAPRGGVKKPDWEKDGWL
jgi:hypothetical protein